MTKINKILMHGFKSFAKRTEMPFGDKFNIILGPNGSGKCVVGDTKVQLADGSSIEIQKLVENNIKKLGAQTIDDGELALGGDVKILCLDTETLKTKVRHVQSFVKRTSPKKLVRIRTRSGREITATEYHPLFVMDGTKIKSIRADELQEGVRVAVPRSMPVQPKTKIFYELLDKITAEDGIYVPYDPKFKEILGRIKQNKTLKQLAQELDISFYVLKGLCDEQSINFAHLVKILRKAGLDNDVIMTLIPRIKAKTSRITYKMPWKNSPSVARLLGYLLAEGRLTNSNQIWFTNGCEEVVADYHSLIQDVFDLRATVNEYKSRCWDVLAYSIPAQIILHKLGMSLGATGNKKITDLFLTHSSPEELGALLDGLYSGDGYVSQSSIEITTKSKKLAQGIKTILLRLGILFRSKDIIKIATNSGYSGKYEHITVTGVDNFKLFHSFVQFTHPKKQERLENLQSKKTNPNLDLLEVNALIKQATHELRINIKRTKKTFAKLDAYCYNQCLPSRSGVQQLMSQLFTPTATLTGVQSQTLSVLQAISTSDIYWDEIVELESMQSKEKWVYDLCVENDHNFVANNFFVHNSNVLDALCFVLGKSSAKALRTEKSANLIYNGGKSKKPAKSGEVSIFFDNKKKIFPTEEDEVKISRIVKPKGNSVYKINNETRTRQQILELLSLARINPNGYNVILQGDIVRFVEMPPEERRLIIEEIAGISVYEEKKQKAVNELNKVEEKLKESGIVLKERKTHLQELGKEKEQAQKYNDLTHKIKVNKASLLHATMVDKKTEKEKLSKVSGQTKQQLEEKQNRVLESKEKIKGFGEEISGINKQVEERGEKGQVEIHKEVEKLKVDIASSKNRVEAVKNEISKIKQRKVQLRENHDELGSKIKKHEENKKELQAQLAAKQKLRGVIEQKIADFKKKNKLDNVGDIEKQVDELDKEAEQKQKAMLELRQKQQELLREKDKIEFQIQSIDEKIQKVLEVEKENQAQVKELKQKKEEFKKSTLELSKLINHDSNLCAQLDTARGKRATSSEQLGKLRAQNLSIQEVLGRDLGLKKILEQKQKGSIQGIHGTVSELGTAESKYSKALEIAAGSKLKSVVVDSDKTAVQCIKFLKENKFGVASFVPMNKIRGAAPAQGIAELKKANGVHGLAIDLLQFNPKYKTVFSHVFGNTLVVDSIDVARRIGVGKVKMVSLDGDLSELSGVMQGGYRKRLGIGFQQKEVTSDIEKYEKILQDAELLISRIDKERKDLEQNIARLRQFKADLEGDIIKLEKVLNIDAADTEANRKVRKELEKALEESEKDIRKVEDDIQEQNRTLAQNRIKKQEMRNKIVELRNPSLIAELNAFEEKRKQSMEEGLQRESDLKNLDAQMDTILRPELENILKIIKQHDKEEEDFKEELAALDKLMQDKGVELKQKETAQQKFHAQFKELFAKRGKLDESIKKETSKMEEVGEQVRKIELRLNTSSIELSRVNAEIAGLEHEYKDYEGIEIVKKPAAELRKQIGIWEGVVTKLGAVNMKALEIYTSIEKEYASLVQKKEKLIVEKEDVLLMMNEIETKKKNLFMKTFDIVNNNFKVLFSAISTKGDASIVLENPESPFDGGLMIKVRLSGKRFLDIRSLSGGEKTLTALAFIFAIQEHEPASFYVLDEVDAALDKRNSERFAQLIRKYTGNAQYVVITHNDAVIAEADRLYGVSMNEHGVSQVTSLKV